ncbi:MAG: hypoxanthine phosphoribosyltransferase [Solirubrobacteraceae bacterium]
MELEPSVREQGLLARERPVVVLYSGGRDSMCLLDLAIRIVGASPVTALHVNYGLREAAQDDEKHCVRTCEQLGVTLEVRHVRRDADGVGNLQAWARDERYAAARAVAGLRNADIAAGHTSTDQVETILYRLASSPSRRALLGMRARDGRVIRPLLRFSRADTGAYCAARGLQWREDETNASGVYARGRVRHELVPALQRIHPAAEANLLALAQTLREEAAVLDELVESVLAGRSAIALSRLRGLAPALQRLVVQRLADAAAGAPAAGVARRAAEIANLDDRGTAMLDLPSGVRVTARRGLLTFAPTPHLRSPFHGSGGAAAATNSARSAPPRIGRVSGDAAIGEVLVAEADLTRRVRELAAEISRDYAGRELLLIGVLKGAVFFLSDLMRNLDVPVEVDFMAVASYGSSTKSSGVVRILKDLDAAIEGRDVLIVEDIVDSGLTLQYLLRNLAGRHPASLEVCALLVKPERQKVELQARYVGFEIPDRFAIGYGLDHAERYRNLPYVAALRP